MSLNLYIVVSVIGVFACHVLATNSYYGPMKWRKYCNYAWLILSVVLGVGHYGLAFANDPMTWNLLIKSNDFVITEELSDTAFLFTLLTAATAPPSVLINGTVHLISKCYKKIKKR